MTRITARQTTDGIDLKNIARIEYEEPPIEVTATPRAKISVAGAGPNAYWLAAGKEVDIKRGGSLVFPGVITTGAPSRSVSNGGEVSTNLVHRGYHRLRRLQNTDYDFDEDGDPATTRDGVTVNNWDRFIYREPASTLDAYGNGYPVHGINVTDVQRSFAGTRFVYQHAFEDNSHLLASQAFATSNGIQVYRDGATGDLGPRLQRVRKDGDGFSGTTAGIASPLDSSGNGHTLTESGTLTTRASPESRFVAGYDLGDGTNGSGGELTTNSIPLASFQGDFSATFIASIDSTHGAEFLLVYSDSTASSAARPFSLDLDGTSNLRYTHGDGSSTAQASAASTIATGFHRITVQRDNTAKTVKVYDNGSLAINIDYSAGPDPTASPASAGLSIGDVFGGNAANNELDGAVYEVRLFDSVVPQATLDQLVDPSDDTYKRSAEGSELALWFLDDGGPILDTIESIPLMNGDPYIRGMGDISTISVVLVGERNGTEDPAIELCRDAGNSSGAGLVNNASRTYSSVTLTHTATYNGSGLSAWTGSVNLSGDAAVEKGMLGYRISIAGADGSANTTKIHYVALVATTVSDVDLTEGTAETYSNGTALVDSGGTSLRGGAVGNEEDWVVGDFLGMKRQEAVERLRTTTVSDSAVNTSPHWDFHIDKDLAYHWQERRGTDKTREYSVDAKNLLGIKHLYDGEEVAYQTIAYGAGSGSSVTRIVNKREFSAGGLYDSDRDPTTGSATQVELSNVARVMEFVDSEEASILTLHRKAYAFHKLHRNFIQHYEVDVLAEHIPFFETGDGIVVRDIPTRSNGTLRATHLRRVFTPDNVESLKVTFGDPPMVSTAAIGASQEARSDTLTVRAPKGTGSVALSGPGYFFDKDHIAPVPFNVPDGVERCSLRITTMPWQANSKSAKGQDTSETTLLYSSSSGVFTLSANATDSTTVSDSTIATGESKSLDDWEGFNFLFSYNLGTGTGGRTVKADLQFKEEDGTFTTLRSSMWELDISGASNSVQFYIPSKSLRRMFSSTNTTTIEGISVILQEVEGANLSFDNVFFSCTGVPLHVHDLDFGIYQFDGDSGDGTGAAVFCQEARLSIDAADADSDGLPTTAEFDAAIHPNPIGKSTQSRTIDVDATGWLRTSANGNIEPGVHYLYMRGATASNNANGLGVVSVTPSFTFRQQQRA